MVKILHTADVHLGAPFHFLGAGGQRHRRQVRRTFGRIVNLVAEDAYDLLVIAGDLCDSNDLSQNDVDYVIAALSHCSAPVCILPGNHDPYDSKSVYARNGWGENVWIARQEGDRKVFPRLDLTVYGNPITSPQSRQSPLRGLKPCERTRWHVAMAHGNVQRPDVEDPPRPIRRDEIAACGMDYLALGDWHAYGDYSEGDVVAIYPGAPEPTERLAPRSGYVACVKLDAGGVRVSRKRVGLVKTKKLELRVEGRPRADLVGSLMQRADEHLILSVILAGLSELGQVLDAERLAEELAPAFYHVEIADATHPQLEEIVAKDYAEGSVIGRFARSMQARIEDARDETERRRAEQALQLGLALLQGREVL